MNLRLEHGDSLTVLQRFADNSIDSIVTDPPYGLKFMGKKWDYNVPSIELWTEILRVLKPGGYAVAFCGTRTYHRLVVNMEDAGFEIRDQIQWIYGSGFPKSHNLGKAYDKKMGNEREVTGSKTHSPKGISQAESRTDTAAGAYGVAKTTDITKGSSIHEGWGTALKPANEPIVLARKPISEKTVIDNAIKWGTGGINIDASRVPAQEDDKFIAGEFSGDDNPSPIYGKYKQRSKTTDSTQGRFPANVIHDGSDEVLAGLESAARFFYCPKVSKKERNFGLDQFEDKETSIKIGLEKSITGTDRMNAPNKNAHPTVKPVALMAYLCKLITPVGGTILDPFNGSGSTGIAAIQEGFSYVGIDLDEEHIKVSDARIRAWNS